MGKRQLTDLTFNKTLVRQSKVVPIGIFEVDKLDELLDLKRRDRPEVFADAEEKLRVALLIDGVLYVSKPVTVIDVLTQANEFPGETFADAVMNAIEKAEKKA